MTEINEKNGKYLEDQALNLGMGEVRDQLWAKIPLGLEEFQLELVKMYGNVEAKANLNYGLSEQGYYFMNSFDFQVKVGEDVLKQNFRVFSKPVEAVVLDQQGKVVMKDGKPEMQLVNNNYTMKEAFNLLAEKGYVRKEFVNSTTKEKYGMWINVDFKNTDKYGNFILLKTPDFDLLAKLREYPIKELKNPEATARLLSSLERGNSRQSVTFVDEKGVETKMYVKVAPQFKSIDIYNDKMERQRFVVAPKDEQGQAVEGNALVQNQGKNLGADEIKKNGVGKGEKPAVNGTTVANKKPMVGKKNEVEKKNNIKPGPKKAAVRR